MCLQGAFAEYATEPVFGVHKETRTIIFPASGSNRLAQTSLRDLGTIVADSIVTGRGRNQFLYTANAVPTFEEYAQLLEKVTNQKWTRVVRTKEESEAAAASAEFFPKMIATFELAEATDKPISAWPMEQTYNQKYNIPMANLEDIVKKRMAAAAAGAAAAAAEAAKSTASA